MMNGCGSGHCHQRANPQLRTHWNIDNLSSRLPLPSLSLLDPLFHSSFPSARPHTVMILASSKPKVAGSCWTAGRWCWNRDECASLLLGIIIYRLSALLFLPLARSSFLLIRLLAGRLGWKGAGKGKIGFPHKITSTAGHMQMWIAVVL